MNNLEQFLADYPFKLFIPEIDWFQQTADEAKVMLHKAYEQRMKRNGRNAMNQAAGGFVEYPPNHRDVVYISERGARRRYQLGRD
jgi:hypothetical protein